MNFQALLDASKNTDINKAFEEETKKNDYNDPRYFVLRKKDEVGKATIRWLPHMSGKSPFIKRKEHFFQHEKKWFSSNNLTSIGKEDPASNFYSKLWERFNETDDEFWRTHARKLKPRDRYISLIYVVNDPNDTQDDAQSGLVKLYKYGPEIYNILVDAAKKENDFGPRPESAIINPFSVSNEGANFGLILKKENPDSNEYPNYSSSTFLDKGALFDGDEGALRNMMEMNENNFYDIYDELDESAFASYEEIEKNLVRVFGDLYIDLMGSEMRINKSTSESSSPAENEEHSEEKGNSTKEESPKKFSADVIDEPEVDDSNLDEDFSDFFNS